MATEKLQVEIEFTEDKKSTKKVFDDLEKEAKKTGDEIGNISGPKKFVASLTGSIGKLGAALGAVSVVAVAAGVAISRAVDAASQQENAINSLNSALRINNELTAETSRDLQDYASELQKVTKFGDEAVIEQLAFAQSMGASAEQSKLVVSAAADLASALNIDLNSATRNVAKTLGGFAGELGEVIPELKALSSEQLQAGEGVQLLANRFSGAASDAVNTFSGRTTQLSNSLGDLFESIGFIITNSPILQSGIEALTTTFEALNSVVKDLGGEPPQILSSSEVKRQIQDVGAEIDAIDQKIELLSSKDRPAFFGLTSTFASEIEGLKEQKQQLVLQDIELNTQLNEINQRAVDQERARQAEKLAAQQESQQKSLEALASLGIMTEEILIQNIEREAEVLRQARENDVITEEEFAELSLQRLQNFEDQKLKIAEQGNKKRNKEQLNANKILANSVANGTAALFKSIFAGENAFDALGNFVLNTLGDLATQTGQFFIAQGIAIEALNAVSGTGAVVAGVALVALGQLFKSFTSGGGSAGAGTVPTGGGAAVPTFETASVTQEQIQEEAPEAGNQVNITVEGNILDRRETGLELVSVINEAIDSDNVVINQSFA